MVRSRRFHQMAAAIATCVITSGIAAAELPPSDFDWAVEYRNLLRSVSGAQIVCEALATEFNAELQKGSTGCKENVANSTRSVIFRVEATVSVGVYQITLLGKSTALALNNKFWCERHRLRVYFGF